MSQWLAHAQQLRRGDWAILLIALLGVIASFNQFWYAAGLGGLGEWAVIRQNGRIIAELDLRTAHKTSVTGPLGETWIEIAHGKARIAADPGPRQYCVKQGWLSRNGEIAICAPNQVSLQIRGRQNAYDSLAY